MIKIIEKKTTRSASSLPEYHYFTGKIGEHEGLFAKLYEGDILFMGEGTTVMLPKNSEIENYHPVVKMLFNKSFGTTVNIGQIPSGTYFTGKTCYKTGLFLKLPNGGFMQLEGENLKYIASWGNYAKDNIVEDYRPVELNLTVEVQ
jgi:hypothetical protein